MLGGGGGGDGKGKPFSLLSFLSSEGQLLRWKSQGLPSDKLSSENAIVILNAPQPPLIIDPSSQATGWLKTYLQALTPTLAPAPTLAPSPTLTLTLTPTLTLALILALAPTPTPNPQPYPYPLTLRLSLSLHLQAQEVPLECVTPHEARFANALELGVRFGKTVVLGEADSIAPLLVPLLRRDLSRQGPRFVVQAGSSHLTGP